MSALGQKQTFTPNSGHVRCNLACPLCANSGHHRQLHLPMHLSIHIVLELDAGLTLTHSLKQ